MHTNRIYLVGLMGAGKSTVGKILAETLGWKFQDLDHAIEELCGKSIPHIFRDEGEDNFRDYESQTLMKSLDQKNIVIACGGGVVTRKENVDILKNELTVWLELTTEQAAARLEYSDHRPLLSECEDTLKELGEILDQRKEAYTVAARIRINSGDDSPDTVANKIIDQIESLHV